MKKSMFGSLVLMSLILVYSCSNDMKDKSKIPGFDLANLDQSVSPSDDFFQYSTGGWQKMNQIPDTESRWGMFNVLREESEERIRKIVDKAVAEGGEKGSDSQMIGDFYKSAMDSSGIEEMGLKPLEPIFAKIEALKSYSDFPKFFSEGRLMGISSPIGVYIGADRKNSTMNIVNIGQGGLSLPDRDYYLGDAERFQKIRAQYIQHITNMFELAGDSPQDAKKNANIVMAIETELAENSMSRIERRDPGKTYNKLSADELQQLSPNYDWNQYFSFFNIEPKEVVVGQVDFLKATNKQFENTPIEQWKVYFKWHTLSGFASWLPNKFVQESFAFNSGVMAGVDVMKSREKRASRLVNGRLGQPLGKLYVAEFFPESSKKDVENLIENLRAAYIERVAQLDWMGEETKEKATDKLKAFTYKIGYPDNWDDFSTLDIVPNNVVHNLLEINKWFVNDNISKFGKEVDKTKWGMTPQTVNAYYNPVNNEVVFPAGILQHPFYSPDADVAINYGAIGGVIGHEFSHGFDDSGSRYDKNGNLNDWWTEEDRARFEAKTAIVVEQFDNFEPYPNVFVQGKLTLGENIADLGGLTLGYYALQKHYEQNGGREDLAGFSPEQRFFLGWAQVWASLAREEYVKQQVTTDPHSPAPYRVNGPMSNMIEFRKAFNIKDGSPMARTGEEQVVIW
jgi:putative endopeptidase